MKKKIVFPFLLTTMLFYFYIYLLLYFLPVSVKSNQSSVFFSCEYLLLFINKGISTSYQMT